MPDITTVERIARFALRADGAGMAPEARDRLKRSLLDALGCAIGALGAGPVEAVRALVDEFGGSPVCTLIGGGRSSPDRAGLLNGCLVRYLDFMDNTARQGEVCHPADNTAAVLAASEHAGSSGADFLTALAVAYQVQTRLLELPTMRAGVNYTTPLSFSVAAGAGRVLGLDEGRLAHALALAGVGAVSLATIQAEPVSNWKGLSSGEAAGRSLHNTYLARNGITGTLGVFDGPLGLFQLVDARLDVDWETEELDVPLQVSIKRHNAEFQSQTSVDLAIELRDRHGLAGAAIDRVIVEVAQGAYDVLGGGKYGPKHDCRHQGAGGPQPPLPRGGGAARRRGVAGAVPSRAHPSRRCPVVAAQGRGRAGRVLHAPHPGRDAGAHDGPPHRWPRVDGAEDRLRGLPHPAPVVGSGQGQVRPG